MSSQLLEDTLDHAHADELMTRLGLPEHFDGDRFDRVSRTHQPQINCQRRSS